MIIDNDKMKNELFYRNKRQPNNYNIKKLWI